MLKAIILHFRQTPKTNKQKEMWRPCEIQMKSAVNFLLTNVPFLMLEEMPAMLQNSDIQKPSMYSEN